jgi:VanZ family protein
MRNTLYLLVAYILVLTFLSLNPWVLPGSTVAFGHVTWDKIEHTIAYGAFAGLILYVFKFVKRKLLASITVLLVCSIIGIGLEFCQYWFTSTRNFSLGDAGANVLGACLGVLGFWWYSLFEQSRSK